MSDGETPAVERSASGLFRSLKQLVATLVALVHTRLELFTTELQEEVQRAAGLVLWSVVAMLAAVLGLFFVGITIIIAFWDQRLLAAILVTAGFLVIAAVGATIVMVKFRNKRPLLAATRAELGKDRAELEGR